MAGGPSAPDVITYVGVPLAVLGVLPILYSFVRAILVQRSIRRILYRHDMLDSAVTRGSLMEGIVEVELPRYTITPLDRDEDPEYWKLNADTVSLKGGRWMLFNWNRMITGHQLYRCVYKDELRIPEADIDFEELVSFLLDRGAVSDPNGWRILKSIGLWTPAGTPLLLPPRGKTGTVLKLMPPDNADGVLSLQVDWKSAWDCRGIHSLPPFWVRLEQPRYGKILADKKQALTNSLTVVPQHSITDKNTADEPQPRRLSRENTLVAETNQESDSSPATSIIQIIENKKGNVTTYPSDSVRFKIDGEYVQKVSFEDEGVPTGETREIGNLGEIASLWFICTASALTPILNCGLWTFTVPSSITSFVKRESIPCGVMVILGMLSDDDVPPWASPPPPMTESHEEVAQRMHNESYERRLENSMPPAQAAEARRVRMMRQGHDYHTQHIARQRRMKEYEERRLIEAIQSPRLENETVASATLAYLVREKVVPEYYTTQDVAHAVLYLFIVDHEQAKVIADILGRWTLWSQYAGMQTVQLDILINNKIAFCYAAALVSVVRQARLGDANASSDMLECLRLWKRVRLG